MTARPILCLVTDRRIARRPLVEDVTAAVAAGVDEVQVRERDLGGAALASLTTAILEAARRSAAARRGRVRVLVNRRLDVAIATGADGVHLGFDAVAPRDARALLGPRAWISVATHAAAEALEAARETANQVHIAPIFAPLSKPASRPPLGLGAIREAAASRVAVLAQGGVSLAHVAGIVAAGAAGIAVTGSILLSSDPFEATAALRRTLDGASRG